MVLSTVARANTAFATAGALSTTALATAGLVDLPTTTFATPQPLPSPLAAVASSAGSREGRGQILPGDPRHGRAGIWMGGTAAECARASGRWVRQLLPWNMGL